MHRVRRRHPFVPTLTLALLFVSAAGTAAAASRPIDRDRSAITIRVSKAGLLRAFADNHVIRAPIAGGAIEETGAPQVHLTVDASDLRVLDPNLSPRDRGEVQARMLGPDVLDAPQYPEIRFRSTGIERVGTARWLVRGSLALHGRTRGITVAVALDGGHYTGRTMLRQTDFGMAPISIGGGTIKVKDEIGIEFDIVPAAATVPAATAAPADDAAARPSQASSFQPRASGAGPDAAGRLLAAAWPAGARALLVPAAVRIVRWLGRSRGEEAYSVVTAVLFYGALFVAQAWRILALESFNSVGTTLAMFDERPERPQLPSHAGALDLVPWTLIAGCGLYFGARAVRRLRERLLRRRGLGSLESREAL